MTGPKTNERPGTRSVLKHYHMSATKARQVLDMIRGEEVGRAAELLATIEREAAGVIGKVLASAVANAVHNDGLVPDDLYVAACYADEGTTMKRWRPRARGRATRIRKRTCHITVIVAELPEERLERRRAAVAASGESRSRRVAESRRRADLQGRLNRRQTAAAEAAEAEAQEAANAEATDETQVNDDAVALSDAVVTNNVTEETSDVVSAADGDNELDDATDQVADDAADTDAGAATTEEEGN